MLADIVFSVTLYIRSVEQIGMAFKLLYFCPGTVHPLYFFLLLRISINRLVVTRIAVLSKGQLLQSNTKPTPSSARVVIGVSYSKNNKHPRTLSWRMPECSWAASGMSPFVPTDCLCIWRYKTFSVLYWGRILDWFWLYKGVNINLHWMLC